MERGLRSVLDPRAWPAMVLGMLRHGLTLPKAGESHLGQPADVLIDSQGRVVASHYGVHADDHWDVDEVLALAHCASSARPDVAAAPAPIPSPALDSSR